MRARMRRPKEWAVAANSLQGDFFTYDFGPDKFTVSVAAGVVDYVKDTPAFMKKMDAVTSGAFVVSWPENGLTDGSAPLSLYNPGIPLQRSRYSTLARRS